MFKLVREDLWHAAALWRFPPWRRPLVAAGKLAFYPRVRALLWYRISHALWQKRMFRPVALLVQARGLRISGAELHPAAIIGGGCMLGHSAGIVIGASTRVGRNATIYQGVTLGDSLDGRPGQPVVGDRVVIGAGAKVLGPVSVGDDARIAANAVVRSDVPAAATAAGVPARIVNHVKRS